MESTTSTSKTSVEIVFSEPVAAGAENPGNYTITGPGEGSLEVVAAYVQADGRTVTLGTAPQQEVMYTLSARNLQLTASGNVQAGSTSFRGTVAAGPIVASTIALDAQRVLVTYLDPNNGQGATMGDSALETQFYEITPPLNIETAEFHDGGADRSRVVLHTVPQDAVSYTIKVTNVMEQGARRLVDPYNNTASWAGIAADDGVAPSVIDATATSDTSVLVSFPEPVTDAAADPSLYTVSYEAGDPAASKTLAVTSATLNEFNTQVTLTTLPMEEGVTYTVTVATLRDLAGNEAAGATDTFVGIAPLGGGGGTPPSVAGVVSTSNTSVVVTFSEPVLGGPDSAEEPSHYRIHNKSTSALQTQSVLLVDEAVLSQDGTSVTLTTLAQAEIVYTVEVANVRDYQGNQITVPRFASPSNYQFLGTPRSYDPTDDGDGDGDGVSDAGEQAGWTVEVTLTSGTIERSEVTSDPAIDDTDGDGITDDLELIYRTNPRSGDTDADGLSDYQELNEIYSEPTQQDSDGDALNDGLEFDFFETSPLLADTDGDQIPDDVETTAANRNPRAADLPRHAIEIGDVAVELIVEFEGVTSSGTTESSSEAFSTTLTETRGNELSSSSTETTEWYAKASLETEVSAEYPGGFGASATFTAEAGVGASGTYVQSQASRQASEQVYEDSLESNTEQYQTETVTRTVTGARLVVPVTLRNVNDISFTMQDVEITALIPDPRNPTQLRPIGTLFPPESASSVYNLGTIDTQLGPFKFETRDEDINPDLIETLLRNPASIVLEVSNFNITDEFGNQFSYQQQDVTERTAPVLIDFGNGRVERYWAATNTGRAVEDTDGDGDVDDEDRRAIFDANGDPVGITFRQVLEDVIGLDHATGDLMNSYDTNSDGEITRVRDIEITDPSTQAWHILTREGLTDGVTADDVILTRGSSVGLVFVTDEDNDGVARRVEYLYGTYDDPDIASDAGHEAEDSDSDGVTDFDEIFEPYEVAVLGEPTYDVFSNPVKADTDGDGLDDFAERDATTDPILRDTDGDGACDGAGVDGCPVDQYPLDPSRSGRPPLLLELLFTDVDDDALVIEDTSEAGHDVEVWGSNFSCGTTEEPDRFGSVGQAYWFGIVNNSECGNDSEYVQFVTPHLDIGSSFSIAFWMSRGHNADFIMGQASTDDTNATPWIELDMSGSDLRFSAVPEGSASAQTVSAPAADVEVWAFYIVTVDNDGTETTMTIRTATDDGTTITLSQPATTSFDGQLVSPSTDPFVIGARSSDFGNYQGSIDDIRIYDGVLSDVNIREIYGELIGTQ